MSIDSSDSRMTLIYGPFKNKGRYSGLEVMTFYNSEGLIEEDLLEDEYRQLYSNPPLEVAEGMVACFESLEDVQKFSFNICQKLKNSGVSLVSLEQYNELVIESCTGEELKEELENKGNFLKNPESEKKGFFNRFF